MPIEAKSSGAPVSRAEICSDVPAVSSSLRLPAEPISEPVPPTESVSSQLRAQLIAAGVPADLIASMVPPEPILSESIPVRRVPYRFNPHNPNIRARRLDSSDDLPVAPQEQSQ